MVELREIITEELMRKRHPEEIRKSLVKIGYSLEEINAELKKIKLPENHKGLLDIGDLSKKKSEDEIELLEGEITTHDHDMTKKDKQRQGVRLVNLMIIIVFIWLGIAFAIVVSPKINLEALKMTIMPPKDIDKDFLNHCENEMTDYEMYTEKELMQLCLEAEPLSKKEFIEQSDTLNACHAITFDVERSRRCGRQIYYVIDGYSPKD